MNMSYYFYMAETEGLLPTRTGRINAVIKEIKKYPKPTIDFDEFEKILKKYKLQYTDLTDREIRYIDASIR